MPEFRHAKEVLTIGSLLAQLGARTYSPVEDVLSAHFFQLCQNPWRKYQENNLESVPTEPRTQMSAMWIFKKDGNYAQVGKPGWRWGWGYIYRLGFSSSRPFSLQTSARPWHKGLTARWYPWTWGSSPESDPNIDLMALWSLTTATFLPICAGKVRWIVCNIELQTNLREVSQSRKRASTRALSCTRQPDWVKCCNSKHLLLYTSSYWFTHCVNKRGLLNVTFSILKLSSDWLAEIPGHAQLGPRV